MNAAEPEILFERRGRLGLITLNRPRALNTLTLGMVRGLDAALRRWADDPDVAMVAIRGEGTRAFCAGGDIRAIYELGRSGREDEAVEFWREEYRLNVLIKEYRKPYAALVRGIVMGGGVGVSVHGSHRVALGEITFAMPEVGIGFFPDVGATYFMPRLPEGVGLWLALTGTKLGTADALALGILTHALPEGSEEAVIGALAEGGPPDQVLAGFARDPGPAPISDLLDLIARHFAGGSVEEILARLDVAGAAPGGAGEYPRAAAAAIRRKSPTSLKIAFEQLRRGRGLDFRQAMRLELGIAARILRSHDLYEGIRAVVVDKDNRPRWRPASLAEVVEADVAAYFPPWAAIDGPEQ